MTDETKVIKVKEEISFYDSLDTLLTKANRILGNRCDLPNKDEDLDVALTKIYMIIEGLIERIEKPRIITKSHLITK